MNRNLPICYGNGYGYFCDIELEYNPPLHYVVRTNNALEVRLFEQPHDISIKLENNLQENNKQENLRIIRIKREDVPPYIYCYLSAVIVAFMMSLYIIIA